jgi:outer membrane biosynthesis protein TonB
MDHATTVVIGLCCVGVAAWTITFWSTQRFLRVFLVISVALHAALFAIPVATGKSAPQEAAAPTLIPYTIIQGSADPAAVDAEIEAPDKERTNETIGLAHKPAAELLDENPLALETEREPRAPEGAVDAELPEIEQTAWFDFDAHPAAASYRRALQHTIQRHFEVPPELEERGYEGRLKVWLNLGRDGRLIYSFLDPIMRSEDEEVNRLTEANLRKMADKFPPFPKGVKDYDVRFYVIIDYRNLRNR